MSDDRLGPIFDEVLQALVRRGPKPQIEARFYPYAGLSSTIRLRQGRVYVRISDLLIHSPREVLYALACILIAKLYRLKISKEQERIYRQHTLDPAILNATEAVRRARGYKMLTSSKGQIYDLNDLFGAINERYFEGRLQQPQLSWSPTKARRVLGHHDPVHGTIVVSRTLDSAKVPRLVVEYVMYHEMLHIKHPPKVQGQRTVYHGKGFRDDEQRFEGLAKALKYLESIALPIRRRKSRKTRPRSE